MSVLTAFMHTGRQLDRRKDKSRAIRLGKPFFMQVQRPLAATILSACALIAILANHALPSIAFGPFFLLICAFGAWFVGSTYAVLLGLFIAVIQIKGGNANVLQDGPLVAGLQFCSALAVVLMLGVARAALEIEWRFARIDPLTGALNRKAFFEALKGEAAEGVAILIFADVNGLKRVNDQHGHEAGDDALLEFSDRIRKSIRKDDIFARIGGDEFIVFLKVADIAGADIVANRLNNALNHASNADELTLSCSLGALVLPGGSKAIDTELKQADTLMYHAKKQRIGLTMAISRRGDVTNLIPFSSQSELQAMQRDVVRSSARA